MKQYYKFFIILLIISFIIPQIALASWWNPFSWHIWNNIFNVFTFKNPNPAPIFTPPPTTPTPSPSPSPSSTPTPPPSPLPACNPSWQCGTWSICTSSLQTRTCVDANSCGVLTNKPSVAQTCVNVCNPNWQCGSWGVCSNSIQARICSDLNNCGNNNGEPVSTQSCSMPQTTPTPTPTPTGKNYYYDSLSRLNSLIAICNSYKTWLQDTSNQFRSASLILAGYPTGGLYGEARDAAINLANAEISVINSQLTNNNQWIAYYEGALNALNSNPKQFVDKSTLDLMRTPESLENDLATIKNDINSNLNSVMSALQYH